MEIMFAMAVFTVGVVTIGYLIIDALVSLQYGTESARARLLAAEGIEAVESIRDGGFDLVSAGTYGLVLNQGLWKFSTSSDHEGKFTRTITILDSGENYKEVKSQVVWSMFGGSQKSISYTTRLTDWQQTGGEAGGLVLSISDVTLTASGTELVGLSFQNSSEENILITGLTVSWDAPALLARVTIAGTDVFNASSSAPVTSGTAIDITNYNVSAYSGSHFIDAMAFNGDVGSSNFIVSFTLQDGSKKSAYISL